MTRQMIADLNTLAEFVSRNAARQDFIDALQDAFDIATVAKIARIVLESSILIPLPTKAKRGRPRKELPY